jgi:hypothetical protein
MSASFRSFPSRSGLFPARAVSRLRPSGLWASPFARRLAKTGGRIEFLSYGPTDSPPVALHLTFRGLNSSVLSVTQLPSAFNQSSVWLRGLSPPIQVRSRAHARRRPRPLSPGAPPGDLVAGTRPRREACPERSRRGAPRLRARAPARRLTKQLRRAAGHSFPGRGTKGRRKINFTFSRRLERWCSSKLARVGEA